MACSLWLLCALDYQFKGLELAALKRRLVARPGVLELQLQVSCRGGGGGGGVLQGC